jgi:hypothetical protein
MHPNGHERIHQKSDGRKYPDPTAQPDLVNPPGPIDSTDRHKKPEQHVKGVGMSPGHSYEQEYRRKRR